jgi:hypothetical protein
MLWEKGKKYLAGVRSTLTDEDAQYLCDLFDFAFLEGQKVGLAEGKKIAMEALS